MSKEELVAAALIGAGLGYDDHMNDKCEEADVEDTVMFYAQAALYAPYAAAMVEAAHSITFTYPSDYQWGIYKYFGECLSDYTEWHEANEGLDEDDDDYDENAEDHLDLPSKDYSLSMLESIVFSAFCNVVQSATQRARLREVIAQARIDAA